MFIETSAKAGFNIKVHVLSLTKHPLVVVMSVPASFVVSAAQARFPST